MVSQSPHPSDEKETDLTENTSPSEAPPEQEAPNADWSFRIHGLGKCFGTHWAVRDLSLTLRHGEVYGLLGPNGAGKTTTLRMIAGLIEPDEGSLQLSGVDRDTEPLEARKKIGFVTGSTGLYQRLTPLELLHFFAKLHELPKHEAQRRIDELVDVLGLESFSKQQAGTLSTGQKQRVNLARALLHSPTLLILDEPTAGLDIISADFILKTIQKAREDGRSVILSTHILTEIELLCDRIGILLQGKLVQEGTLATLLQNTQTSSLAQAFLKIVQAPTEQAPSKEQSPAATEEVA
ncbi:MAG: ABC transporter ATP-binding protein [Myxococcales bacterium]|nr:ABC transporter ATP-binding protein [Myxococcales bacterium]MCB9644256.1 ABC transporter ATP-binding protein [Myxococcales bacterium]